MKKFIPHIVGIMAAVMFIAFVANFGITNYRRDAEANEKYKMEWMSRRAR